MHAMLLLLSGTKIGVKGYSLFPDVDNTVVQNMESCISYASNVQNRVSNENEEI
jgi:hypothetical protein